MIKPYTAHYNKDRDTSILFFMDENNVSYTEEYYMRGGVCWPLTHRFVGGNNFMGYIIVGGVNVKTKKVVIFEETSFRTINHIIKDNVVSHYGISDWLNNVWNTYFISLFYWNQNEETTKKYRRDVLRSEMIMPKPYFKSVHWDNDDDVLNDVDRYVTMGNTSFESSKFKDEAKEETTDLYNAVKAYKVDDKDIHPAMRSFMCFVYGIEKYQWQEPAKKREPVLEFKKIY